MEEWKTIKGTDGKYSVSDLGNVRRNEHYTIVSPTLQHPNGAKVFYKERKLKGYIDSFGYKVVNIKINGKNKGLKIHRLVADNFIPNTNNLPQINHKDENRLNNASSNLEWCTSEYNNNYGTRKEKLRKTSGIRVAQYSLDGKLIKIWDSVSQASQSFGCKTTSCIRRVCKKLKGRNTYKGYVWRYVDKKVIGDSYLKEQLLNNKQEAIDLIFSLFSREEKIELYNRLKREIIKEVFIMACKGGKKGGKGKGGK